MNPRTSYKILAVLSVLSSIIGAGIFMYRLSSGIFEISWIFVFLGWFFLTQSMSFIQEIK